MSNTSSKLTLVIAGDNHGAVKAIGGVDKSIGGLTGKTKGLGSAIGGAFSIGAVTGFAKAAVHGYEDTAASVAKVQRITGAAAEDASLLVFGAQQAGVQADKAATAYGILASNIENGKVAAEGIATTNADGSLLQFDQILANISDHLAALPTNSARAAEARKLFGRGGLDLVKILGKGSEALEAQRQEMQDLGLEFDEAGLKKYKKFLGLQRDLQAQVTGLEVAIGDKLVPVLGAVDGVLAHIPAGFRDVAGGAALAVGGIGALVLAGRGLSFVYGPLVGVIRAKAVALTQGTVAAEGAAVADEELAVASTEAAVAQGALSTAASGALAALGPIGIGVGIATALYAAFGDQAGHTADDLTKATDQQLVDIGRLFNQIGSVGDFEDMGRKSLPGLKRLRSALADAGESTDKVDQAITNLAADQARADETNRRFGDGVDGTTDSLDDGTAAAEHFGAALEGLKRVDAAKSLYDLEAAASDSASALGQSYIDLAEAQKASRGDSDEYRDAVQQEADDARDVADAQAAERDAVDDLTRAREDATRKLDDYRDSVIKTTISERDAKFAVTEAEAALRAVIADPRTSALERAKAQVELADAKDQATLAEHEHTQAVQDNAAAQKAGVEGDQGVIDAKQKVIDAQERVKDSQAKVAEDAKAKNKIIADAVLGVKAAQDKLHDATLDQITAQYELDKATKGPLAAQEAYARGLKGIYDSLDDKGDSLGSRVGRLMAAINEAIEFQVRNGSTPLLDTLITSINGTGASGSSAPGRPGGIITTIPGEDHHGTGGGLLSDSARGVHLTQVLQGTPTQTRRAARRAAISTLDEIARGRR